MKESDMNSTSETDWNMVDSLTDETIDRTELPPLDDSFFARARWRMPEKKPVPVTIHIDPDLLAWFKSQGSEYEQRMNAALRIYAQAHKDMSFSSA
ncbi:BrnA antitoxin family protein [Desulfococcaceae bacterium HSG8]|nr:BrnA antitoxin family protein [Desulfococcaceae bacterium HSG8]